MATRVEEVTVRLREMIVTRRLAPGSRVPERDIGELLGVSRTPVRMALGILEAEGLVAGKPHCGFVVNPFGIDEVLSAYDVRGVLEGLAARTAVERGMGADNLRDLEQSVADSRELVEAGVLGNEEMRRWSAANDVFHRTLLTAAGLPALTMTHAFLSRMPMAAPVAIMFTGQQDGDLALAAMAQAHDEHVHVLDAIRRGEGARAEYLMREHAQRSRDNLGTVLRERLQDHVQSIAPRKKRRTTHHAG